MLSYSLRYSYFIRTLNYMYGSHKRASGRLAGPFVTRSCRFRFHAQVGRGRGLTGGDMQHERRPPHAFSDYQHGQLSVCTTFLLADVSRYRIQQINRCSVVGQPTVTMPRSFVFAAFHFTTADCLVSEARSPAAVSFTSALTF